MTLRFRLAAATACIAVLAVPASAATASSVCRAKRERAGCRLANARYEGSSFGFSIRAGSGVSSGFGTLACSGTDGSRGHLEVLYPPALTRPQAITRPVVGRTYRRRFAIGSHVPGKVQSDATIDLRVTVTSSSRLTMTFAEHLRREAPSGKAVTCTGTSRETLKRVE